MASLRSRWLLFFGISAVLLAAQSVAYPALTAPPPPASPPQPSYKLSIFEIQYPYVDPRDEYVRPSVDRRTQAALSYSAAWLSDSFPGKAQCQIVLYGAGAEVVGRYRFELISYSPEALKGEGFGPPVRVSARPVAASGSCKDSIHPADNL